jgi:D-alanyl-lipoteichoic acid acyltransferase DltB (MBOAT superfamily)
MSLNSISFLIFFGLVFPLYYLFPKRYKINVLLVSSILFFISNALLFFFVVLFLIIWDYYAAILMKSKTKFRRAMLIISITCNILVLVLFKYISFLSDNLNAIGFPFHFSIPETFLKIFIPVGLSFFVFKSISFLIEAYRNTITEKIKLNNLCLYFLFFPSVLSGPIDRPGQLLKEFSNVDDSFYSNIRTGISFILLGFIKKSVIADNISIFVDITHSNPEAASSFQILIIAILYSFQIYYDFSGYSDIALGTAKMFGINIIQNFNMPYFTKSIQDFWRCWHISLSSWLRDYIFLPLAYSSARFFNNRKMNNKEIERYSYIFSIFVTMLIAGIWHGANWTFIVWGLIMGVYIIFSFITKKSRMKIKKSIKFNNLKTLNSIWQSFSVFILVTFAWIFFRAESMNTSLIFIKKIFAFDGNFILNFGNAKLINLLFVTIIFITGMLFAEKFKFREIILNKYESLGYIIKLSLFILVISFLIFFGNYSTNSFIYFKF